MRLSWSLSLLILMTIGFCNITALHEEVESPIFSIRPNEYVTIYVRNVIYQEESSGLEETFSELFTDRLVDITEKNFLRVSLSDGGGCVKMLLKWRSYNLTEDSRILSDMIKNEVFYAEKNYSLTFHGCSGNEPIPPILSADYHSSLKIYVRNTHTADAIGHRRYSAMDGILAMLKAMLIRPAGGSFQGATTSPVGHCIKTTVTWMSGNVSEEIRLITEMVKAPFMYDGYNFSLTFERCDDFVPECKDLQYNTSDICVDVCNDFSPRYKCLEGYKCCITGCGNVCVKVEEPRSPIFIGNGLSVLPLYFPTILYNEKPDGASSDLLQELREFFSHLLTYPTKGAYQSVKLSDGGGCVRAKVQWLNHNVSEEVRIINEVLENGISFGGVYYFVSTIGCNDSVGRCPPVEPGMGGACVEDCDGRYPALGCPPGHKCCSNGCGHQCTQVELPKSLISTNRRGTSVSLFIHNLAYRRWRSPSLTSTLWNLFWASMFDSTGAVFERMTISDGGGCIKVSVEWTEGSPLEANRVVSQMVKRPFLNEGRTFLFSPLPCGEMKLVCKEPLDSGFECQDENQTSSQRFFFDAKSKSCKNFSFKGCGGSENNFETLSGCESLCMPPDEQNSTCLAQLEAAKKLGGVKSQKECSMIPRPLCDENGDFAKVQCLSSFGVCWCVTPKGNYLPDSFEIGFAKCHKYSDEDMELADRNPKDVTDEAFKVCGKGQKLHCCPEDLCAQPCHAHPDAGCRVDPCDGCRAVFYDRFNRPVSCEPNIKTCRHQLRNVQETMRIRTKDNGEEIKEQEKMKYEASLRLSRHWNIVINEAVPLKCQKMPETGHCGGFMLRWFYNPATQNCDMFIWSMCGGYDNWFRTAKECYDQCNPSGNPCASARCAAPTPECELEHDKDCYTQQGGCVPGANCVKESKDTDLHLVSGVFVPHCVSDSSYDTKQCHGPYCWCMEFFSGNKRGLTVSHLQCSLRGPSKDSVISLPACPVGSDSKEPRHECIQACNGKVCHGHPRAECVVDVCSKTCNVTFNDENGMPVECEEEEEKLFCDGENKDYKLCPANVCDEMPTKLCPKNPCAVCDKVDSCACRPYLEDVLTSIHLDPDSRACQFLTKGACTTETCRLKIQGIPEQELPQCTATGAFRAKQCRGTSCHCVEPNGRILKSVSGDESCDEVKEISRIQLSLAFKGDFQRLKSEGKLNSIKEAVKHKFVHDVGIPEENIRSISEPYEGSVMVDAVIAGDGEDEKVDSANIGVIADAVNQTIQNDDFSIQVDGETLDVEKEKVKMTLTSDDDDESEDKTIIIIAVCVAMVVVLVVIVVVICCCCRKKKKKSQPKRRDENFDHVRTPLSGDRNLYDNPTTAHKGDGSKAGLYFDAKAQDGQDREKEC